MNKEKIEKAKERLVKQAVTSKAGCEDYPNCICMKKDLIITLNYIDQLEQENNKQNKIIELLCEQLVGLAIFDIEKDEPRFLGDTEEVKQYFEKKVEEE